MDILALFREAKAILEGHFSLSSGKHSDTYLQCALLLKNTDHAQKVGKALAEKLDANSFDMIISPALGGVVVGYETARQCGCDFVFSERKEGIMQIRRGFDIQEGLRYLIIEDVITTGGSTLEVAELVEQSGGTVAGFACIVDRSGGTHRLPEDPVNLLALTPVLFDPDHCPMCKEKIPCHKPGSKKK